MNILLRRALLTELRSLRRQHRSSITRSASYLNARISSDPPGIWTLAVVNPPNSNFLVSVSRPQVRFVSTTTDEDEHVEIENSCVNGEVCPTPVLTQGITPSDENARTLLNEYYNEHYRCPYEGPKIRQRKMVIGSTEMYSASLICAITKTKFLSGNLRNQEHWEIKGVHYYQSRRLAKEAVSGRAYDALQFEKFGVTEPRFCEEDPFVELVDGVEPGDNIPIKEEPIISHEDCPLSNDGSVISLQTPSIHSEELKSKYVDEENENLFYDQKTGSAIANARTFESLSPAERVLEALNKESNKSLIVADFVDRRDSASSSPYPKPTFITSHESRVTSTVNIAFNWLRSIRKSLKSWNKLNFPIELLDPNRLTLPPTDASSLLPMAKSILNALAEAQQSQPTPVDLRFESLAEQVLNVLWETEHSKPDSGAYAAYILCLGGKCPKLIAKRAHELVDAMRIGSDWRGRTLPKPDQGTYNALIQVTAQVGGITGRCADFAYDDFVPDRRSFLCILSSATYPSATHDETTGLPEPGGFDPEFAKQCIDKMLAMFQTTGDDSFRPDIDIYNAPLRWAGGDICWRQSRPYARYTPWDNYKDMYNQLHESDAINSYEANNNDRMQEAKRMEAWLVEMKYRGDVAPNIETYEAVIQAWLSTASLEGLDRATKIARGLFHSESSVHPRLQTFHPIVASSMFAKRIKESNMLVRYLFKRSEKKNIPELRPDMRMISAFMAHAVDKMSLELAFSRKKLLDKEIARIEEAVVAGKGSEVFLDSILFVRCIELLRCSAYQSVRKKEFDTILNVVAEMGRVVADFERIVEVTLRFESPAGIIPWSDQAPSQQLVHFTNDGQQVYASFIESITELQTELGDSSDIDVLGPHLLLVEQMTRRIVEMYDIGRQQGENTMIRYDDLFQYDSREIRKYTSLQDCLLCVVKYVSQVSMSNERLGDIARLCFLVKNFSTRLNGSSEMNDELDRILARTRDWQGNLTPPNSGGLEEVGTSSSAFIPSKEKKRRHLQGEIYNEESN